MSSCAPIQVSNNNSIHVILLKGNDWKSLFEGNLVRIRLFTLDFYEMIVNSPFSLISYHLIEILSS